jgi:hypothetical protein
MEQQKAVSRKSKPASLWSMFTNPVITLESLRDRPRWLVPVLVSATFSVAVNLYVVRRIGLARLINAAGHSSAVIDPQAAMQSALAHQDLILTFQAASTFVSSILTILVIAKVFSLALTLCGQDTSFKTILATVAYVLALSAIVRQSLLALTATLIQDLDTLDLRNPLATNLAFFLRPSSPVALRILSALDVITIVTIALLVVGLTKVCDRLSPRAASLVVVVPWMAYVGATLLIPSF